MGLQQENPHKNDDFLKIVKKSTFFLKNRFTLDNFCRFFKIGKKKITEKRAFKKSLCVLKEFNLKERHVIFPHHFGLKKACL